MKKIKIAFIGLLMMGLGAGVVNAQDKAATPAKKGAATTQTDKKAAPAASGQHLKKDGTPDKRYKENKTATPAAKSTTGKGTKKTATTKAAATK